MGGPVAGVFARAFAPTGTPVPVRSPLRRAIDLATVIGEQHSTTCPGIDIPHVGLHTQIRSFHRACPVTFAFFQTAVVFLPYVVRTGVVCLPGIFALPVWWTWLVMAGIGDLGTLRIVTVQIIVPLPGIRTAAVSAIPPIAIPPWIGSTVVMTSIVISSGTATSAPVMGVPVTPVAIVRRPVPVSSWPPATMVTMMPIMIAMPVTTGVVRNVERSQAPTQTKIPATPRVVAGMKAPGSMAGIVVIG